jgi:transposase
MSQEKYIGMDVHQATISVAVRDSSGKLIMECILETKAATILEFIAGLRGTLSVTFEEGTSAAWLHDLLKPHVSHLVVCDPRRNALLKDGSKSDRIDARKLAELLHGNQLHAVYHGEHGLRTLKELGRSYLTITKDLTRVMSRIKALYRSWAIPCSGATVYAPRHRAEWLAKILEPGVRLRAERLYQQLDLLQPVRQEARRNLLAESHQHHAVKLLRQIPSIGPIRSALLVALLQTPHRFRTKRQLWAYSGFAVETHDSGEYRFARGKLVRNRERITVRGLNPNHNHDLKNLFKGAPYLPVLGLVEAAQVTVRSLPEWRSKYIHLMMRRGRKIAKVAMARKLAVRLYWMWRKGWDYEHWKKFGSYVGQPVHRYGVQSNTE